MKQLLYILTALLIFSFCSCNRTAKREYARILDSLQRIEVPLVFDTARYFKQSGAELEVDSITPDGTIIQERQDAFDYFYRTIRHKDSLFWNIFEYKSNGYLNCYYKRYIYGGNAFNGYIIYYNEKGKVENFDEDESNRARYSIYDVINKLQSDGIDLQEHEVYIYYTDQAEKKGDSIITYDKYYWSIAIYYYDDKGKSMHKRELRISPDTGEVLEEWTEDKKG